MGAKTQILLVIAALLLVGLPARATAAVNAEDYQAFWFWSGVAPQPALKQAKTLYLHKGEVARTVRGVRFQPVGPAPLPFSGQELWLTVRVETLDMPERVLMEMISQPPLWEQAGGSRVHGLQIDFDAATHRLADYAPFLTVLRTRLDKRYRLSITGLLDWAQTGRVQEVNSLPVDEIVVQTYQGRKTVANYQHYLSALMALSIPFKVGLVQHGEWDRRQEQRLRQSGYYRGEVVFMLNPPRQSRRGE